MDTPVILSALPRKLRKRTVVAAAADYFYSNRLVASARLADLQHGADRTPRRRWRLAKNGSHLDKLLDQGWSVLLYPEGTRSRGGGPGSAAARRRRAGGRPSPDDRADSGHRHGQAMPPGGCGPDACPQHAAPTRHRIEVSFGEPITANGDPTELMEAVRGFFENGGGRPLPVALPQARDGQLAR